MWGEGPCRLAGPKKSSFVETIVVKFSGQPAAGIVGDNIGRNSQPSYEPDF
jgi:hypothetical protein